MGEVFLSEDTQIGRNALAVWNAEEDSVAGTTGHVRRTFKCM